MRAKAVMCAGSAVNCVSASDAVLVPQGECVCAPTRVSPLIFILTLNVILTPFPSEN